MSSNVDLWIMSETPEVRRYLFDLWTPTPRRLEVVNIDDIYYHFDDIDGENDPDTPDEVLEPLYWSEMPQPRLRTDDPDFALDFFFDGLWFVSKAMRDALALPGETVSYRLTDLSACPPSVQAMEYASIGLLRFADVLDPERSEVEYVVDYKGEVTDCWQLAQSDPRVPFARLNLRADLVPPAPLFAAAHLHWLLATDDVAERVLRSGLKGVLFTEPRGVTGQIANVHLALS